DWNHVPSGSMEPTLYDGDWVLVDKTAFGPSIPFTSFRLLDTGAPVRGDVITFYPPHKDQLYVKRVVGVPGDRVRVEGPRVLVNGQQLAVTPNHLDPTRQTGTETIDGREHRLQFSDGGQLPVLAREVLVPDNHYFVLGDHRNKSSDSRYWGLVNGDKITGRVEKVAFSVSRQRSWSNRFWADVL
ncbi:MAG: signal peptidase I, partial [bacterium]